MSKGAAPLCYEVETQHKVRLSYVFLIYNGLNISGVSFVSIVPTTNFTLSLATPRLSAPVALCCRSSSWTATLFVVSSLHPPVVCANGQPRRSSRDQ